MIYTFQEINGTRRYLMFAKDKDEAFSEMKQRFGSDHKYSMVAYTEVENFAMFIK